MNPPAQRSLTLLMAGLLAACQQGPKEIQISGSVQGTTYHIKAVTDAPAETIAELQKQVEAAFADIDMKLSNYRADSEISRFNDRSSTEWATVSPEITGLVEIAKAVHAKSQGCYDLTVKPLFDLWGFSRHQPRVPEPAEVDALMPHIGLDKVTVDVAENRLRKQDPAIRIDLSSIAQGYTVAEVAKILESRGIQDYMAEIGGEMKVRGRKANGEDWRIAVEKPTPLTREVQRILSLHQQAGVAVMTSGTYRNFFEQGGQVYSHIINPKTGKPVNHKLLSVTVLHQDPTWADAWSTALLCLGEEEGYETAEAEGLRALFIYGENKELKEKISPALAREPGL
jgi:thiamine biosynthesis lipoprotein